MPSSPLAPGSSAINKVLILGVAGAFATGMAFGYLFNGSPTVSRNSPITSTTSEPAAVGFLAHAGTPSARGSIWTTKDFPTRLHEALNAGSDRKKWRAINAIADDLNPAEIRAALAEVDQLRTRERPGIVAQLIARWAEQDPTAALEYAQGLKKSSERKQALAAAVGGWAEKDPQAAQEWAAKLTAGPTKDAVYQSLVTAIAASNPEQALTLAQSASPRVAQMSAYAVFNQWAGRDPQAAAARAAVLTGTLRRTALNVVAGAWASTDVTGALAWAQALPDASARRDALGSISQQWAQTDPQAAADFATQLAPGQRSQVLANTLSTWADSDLDGALNWIGQMPDSSEKTRVLQQMSFRGIWQDPARALQIVQLMPAGEMQDNVLRNVASNWIQADPASALAWAQQQTDEHVVKMIWPSIASSMAQNDPLGALNIAQSLTGAERDNTTRNVLSNWAENDPVAALNWALQQIPDGSQKNESVGQAVSTWARNDPAAAEKWIAALPAGEMRDNSLRTASYQFMNNDPATAVQLIAGIGDDKMRTSQYENLAQNWLRNDPQGAQNWIAQAPLTAEVKQRLLAAKRN